MSNAKPQMPSHAHFQQVEVVRRWMEGEEADMVGMVDMARAKVAGWSTQGRTLSPAMRMFYTVCL